MKKLRIPLIILLILAGAGFFLYPKLQVYLSQHNASVAIAGYSASVSGQDDQTIADELKAAQDYNSALSGQDIRDPFAPGSGAVLDSNYQNLLNVNGTMGYLVIPKINVNLPIYHGTSDATLQKGVGHLEGTSLPVGGAGTHAVLTGHTGLPSARLFTDLTELAEGDVFYVHVLSEVLAYQVDQIKVVEPTDTGDLQLTPGQDYVTLMTCTPYGINDHRLLVRGTRIAYDPQTEQNDIAKAPVLTTENRILLRAGIITAAVMLALIVIALLIRRGKNRKNKYQPKHLKK